MLSTIILCVAAATSALIFVVCARTALRLEARNPGSAMAGYILALSALSAAMALLTMRIVALYGDDTDALLESIRNPPSSVVWLGRLQTLILVAFSLIAIVPRLFPPAGTSVGSSSGNQRVLVGVFVYWTMGAFLPSFSNGELSHRVLYLLLGLAAFALCSPHGLERVLRAFRDSTLALVVASLVAFAVDPAQVSDLSYEGAIFGAFPRLAGYTLQANVFGAILAPWFICLLAKPYSNRLLQWVALLCGAAALLATQSKTSMGGLFVGYLLFAWNRARLSPREPVKRAKALAPRTFFGLASLASITTAVTAYMMLTPARQGAEVSAKVESLSSATGRTEIWAHVLAEWEKEPFMGAGPNLFSSGTFASIPELQAVPHAHNQFVDLLGRSGIFGLLGFVVMIYLALRALQRVDPSRQPLGWGLLGVAWVQSMFEVPLTPLSITMSSLALCLLLSVASSARSEAVASEGEVLMPAVPVRRERMPMPEVSVAWDAGSAMNGAARDRRAASGRRHAHPPPVIRTVDWRPSGK